MIPKKHEKFGFCTNSRRWLFKIGIGAPPSCPYKGFLGESDCLYHSCGYYVERELTPNARRDMQILTEIIGKKKRVRRKK